MWTVEVSKPGREWAYPAGYFPRTFRGKKEATELLKYVQAKGAVARVIKGKPSTR